MQFGFSAPSVISTRVDVEIRRVVSSIAEKHFGDRTGHVGQSAEQGRAEVIELERRAARG